MTIFAGFVQTCFFRQKANQRTSINPFIEVKFSTEIDRIRTFGIISHPDAGKTTLTEKLLLFGGAIQTAGAVKNNKIVKTATSDFMEIEKQRGISVATSVMSFEYDGYKINILDTPGHKDFAEDTYRTLTAVDSVILVIDSAKGVEEQTRKLMEVCRMRHTPVLVFINKLDREGKDPFELLEEVEKELHIHTRPLTWPIGMGRSFQGVYNLQQKSLRLFEPSKTEVSVPLHTIHNLNDPALQSHIGEDAAEKLIGDVELIEGVYEAFDESLYQEAYLAPVFFGSAINNFGVKELLEAFLQMAPPPGERKADTRMVSPGEETFSGFVFKIHANIDPKHRNRIAFCRVVSGRFQRNDFYLHTRLNKQMRFSGPTSFMAGDKQIVEEAFPGDVVGFYDTGVFKIGDTLTEGELFQFQGIPSFSPELFRQVINEDPMKSKQLEKGIRQLTDEGVAQLFVKQPGNVKIIGTVGDLQFDVIRFRLLHEYGASCSFHPLNYYKACWVTSENKKAIDKFVQIKGHHLARDKEDRLVFLAESPWFLKAMQEDFPEISFHFTSELGKV